ncbi:MAG: branched-chain amino acid ABC transporter substrate-binding protein [Actinomycetota bacterium]|nr:branched-chain amino acid ABC transporter substrate-binding protein [Actinomycetota bacterium]
MSRRGNRVWRLVALALAGTLVMAACGDDDEDGATTQTTAGGGGAKKTVSIAFVGAKTGDNANLGLNIRDGVKLATDEENAKGGDVTIALKEFDTAGDPAQATTIKDQFIADESIVGIVGPAFSGETKALIPPLNEAGLVMISPSATNKALPTVVPGGARVFHRALGDDILQANGIAQYLATVEKPRNAAYVHDNSEYGKGLTVDTEKAASLKRVRTALVETVDPKAQDFSATVNKVKAASPDLVFYGGYYAEAGRFKKQLADAGVTAKFVSGDGSLDPGFVTAAGPDIAEGARITCPCNLAFENSTGRLKEFYDNFKKEIGREPGLYSPEGYDSAKILIQGIKAGNDTREKLLNWIEQDFTRYEGVSKPIEFEENGNLKATQFFVFQVKDGKIVPGQTLPVEDPAGNTSTTAASGGGTTTTTTG